MRHAAAIDVVGQVIQRVQPNAVILWRRAFDRAEIDVVNLTFASVINEIQIRSANAFDGGNVQFHRPDTAMHRRRAALHGLGERSGGIIDVKGHGVGRRAMLVAEIRHLAIAVHVEDEVDAALRIATDVL